MSKPRYDWWSYVKGMIRRYPQLKAEYSDLKETSVTVGYSMAAGGGGISKPTETAALRELPSTKQREYEAVRRAVETTRKYRTGKERLKVIELYYWKQTHTLEGAGLMVPCSNRTAWEWNREFVYLVAGYFGLMDN